MARRVGLIAMLGGSRFQRFWLWPSSSTDVPHIGNSASWGVSISAVAVGLAPGLLVLSTNIIGRVLLRTLPPLPEVPQPRAE